MLKRTFFTLYFLVVLAILLAGWGLDRLQQSLAEESALSPTDRALFQLLAERAAALPDRQRQTYLADELHRLGVQGQVYRVSDLADTDLGVELTTGKPLVLTTEEGRELYTRLNDLPFILRIQLPQEAQAWQRVLLVGFYLILAVVIYLWVWPLVRDLKSLEAQTRLLGQRRVSQYCAQAELAGVSSCLRV